MVIIKSKVRNHKFVVKTIIKNIPVLDPLVIIKNSDLYYIRQKGKIISFVTLKKYFGNYEVGTVYTRPSYRGNGYAKKLVRFVTAKAPNEIFVMCDEKRKEFYEKCGFRERNDCGFLINVRKIMFNTFFRWFCGYRLISMSI
jgi:GNAT superfamily N-acetyltransferase